jgi:hypothetical protein
MQVSQDAVAEVQMLRANYRDGRGLGSGALVNTTIKSGTRAFHE